MDDNDLLAAVREDFSGVRMDTPAEAILATAPHCAAAGAGASPTVPGQRPWPPRPLSAASR
jgi:hypothetical protein